jgi:hypothetical protein
MKQTLWIIAVGLLLLISPALAAPWGFAAAIAATILGPGHGVPEIVFPKGYLSTPERWLFTVLAGLAVMVSATFVLSRVGIQLDRSAVAVTILSLTTASSIANVVSKWWRHQADEESALGNTWHQPVFFFGTGAVIGAMVAGLVWRIAGI